MVMQPSAATNSSNECCESCHSQYSLIKRKKTCAICHSYYCTNCAPRQNSPNSSYRICLTCQSISRESTTDEELIQLSIKYLRCHLEAKNISYSTCKEKQDLIDLIKRNRHLPFSPTMASGKSDAKSNPFNSFQHSVSTFASQVTSAVSDVVDQVFGDLPNQPVNNNINNASAQRVNGSSTRNAPHRSSSSRTTTEAAAAASTTRPPEPRAPPPPTTSTERQRRKSLSEIRDEENIENLNIRELKEILAANFVDYKGCIEKTELIERVRRLYRDHRNSKIREQEFDQSTVHENEMCKVCMDAVVDCVFLDCGHMVTCVKCGKLLAECPICRSNIVRVVRVFKS